jgi:hypothetical protein
MKIFICHSSEKEQFDYKHESFGMRHERALYYSKSLGKGRVYRSSYPRPPVTPKNDFELYKFDSEDDAIGFCNSINIAYKDDFKPFLTHTTMSQDKNINPENKKIRFGIKIGKYYYGLVNEWNGSIFNSYITIVQYSKSANGKL